jgi:cytochrome P450
MLVTMTNKVGRARRAPERWLGRRELRNGHNTKAFMRFGAGPRFGPGRYLAMLE